MQTFRQLYTTLLHYTQFLQQTTHNSTRLFTNINKSLQNCTTLYNPLHNFYKTSKTIKNKLDTAFFLRNSTHLYTTFKQLYATLQNIYNLFRQTYNSFQNKCFKTKQTLQLCTNHSNNVSQTCAFNKSYMFTKTVQNNYTQLYKLFTQLYRTLQNCTTLVHNLITSYKTQHN